MAELHTKPDGDDESADDHHACIEAAQDVTIDRTELPFDLPAFYELLGFPAYLAEHAGDRRPPDRPGRACPRHVGAPLGGDPRAHALLQRKEGAALERYVRLANDVLFNPEATIDRVEASYEEQVADEDGEQRELRGTEAMAQIERVGEDLKAKAVQFKEREEDPVAIRGGGGVEEPPVSISHRS